MAAANDITVEPFDQRLAAAAKVAAKREHDAMDLAQELALVVAEVRRTDRAIEEAAALTDALDAGWVFEAAGRGDAVVRRASTDDEASTRVAVR